MCLDRGRGSSLQPRYVPWPGIKPVTYMTCGTMPQPTQAPGQDYHVIKNVVVGFCLWKIVQKPKIGIAFTLLLSTTKNCYIPIYSHILKLIFWHWRTSFTGLWLLKKGKLGEPYNPLGLLPEELSRLQCSDGGPKESIVGSPNREHRDWSLGRLRYLEFIGQGTREEIYKERAPGICREPSLNLLLNTKPHMYSVKLHKTEQILTVGF